MQEFEKQIKVEEFFSNCQANPLFELESSVYENDQFSNYFLNVEPINDNTGSIETHDEAKQIQRLGIGMEDLLDLTQSHDASFLLNAYDFNDLFVEQNSCGYEKGFVPQEGDEFALIYENQCVDANSECLQNTWKANDIHDSFSFAVDSTSWGANHIANLVMKTQMRPKSLSERQEHHIVKPEGITEEYILKVRSAISKEEKAILGLNKVPPQNYFVQHLRRVNEPTGEKNGERMPVPWNNIELRTKYIFDRLKASVTMGKYNGSKYSPKVVGNSTPTTPHELVVPQDELFAFYIELPSNWAIGDYGDAVLYDSNAEAIEVLAVQAISRKKYFRGPLIYEFLKSINVGENFELIYNDKCDDHLYAPEFYLVEVNGVKENLEIKPYMRMNKTRRALCPFCPTLQFFLVNVSSYGQHVSQHHGILSDGYVIPNPLNPGNYTITKSNTHRRTIPKPRNAKGVYCPVCYALIEVETSVKTKDKQPLMGYLTHFKTTHSSPERGKKKGVETLEFKRSSSVLKFRKCAFDFNELVGEYTNDKISV